MCQTSVTMELYKSTCVCMSNPRTASKRTKQKLNMFLIGPSNRRKFFLLQPLELIFKCFTSPGQEKYTWTGVDKPEEAFLNKFRWSKELIAWYELLNLLEGAPWKLSRPKNVFATNLSIPKSNGILFLATGIKSKVCWSIWSTK